MTEVYKFLSFIRQYRFALIIVPIITVIITYFLVRNRPNLYASQAQISTGIVDETKQQSVIFEAIQGDQVRQQFSNLMEMIKMKRVLDQVSYLLIIHDLTAPKPFKQASKLVKSLNADAVRHALEVYREKYRKNEELIISNPDQNGLFKVLESMEYDAESIKNKLQVFRSGESDFVNVQFESEDADLSAFVVNTVSEEFIKNYSVLVKANQVKANNFLRDLLREKTDTLASKMAQLRTYKINNQVLNLTEQSKQLYTLLLDYDTKKQEAIEKTASYAGALNEIDRKFSPQERSYIEAKISKVNQSIVNTREELNSVYNMYINSDLDEKYKSVYDSLNIKLNNEISKSSDQYNTNPFNTKQELVAQKLNLEIQMDLSRYSINSLENKINSLRSQFGKLVPKEAEVQTLEMNVDIASKEYLDILNKYNQSSLEAGFASKMNIIQRGVGGLAQPSKKMLLVILSAIMAVICCLLTLLLLFISNRRINTAEELGKATGFPVLGEIGMLTNKSVDLKRLWEDDMTAEGLVELRNQLRSLRYEIESVLDDKILVFCSMNQQEGKTFLSLSLAFAWQMTNMKVLLIDGNFNHPHISQTSTNSGMYLEDFLEGKIHLDHHIRPGSMDVLKNRGGDKSIIEIAGYDKIRQKLEQVKDRYDLVIIEIGALKQIIQSKEWLSFSKNTIGIFKAANTINNEDEYLVNLLKKHGYFKGWILNMAAHKDETKGFFKL